MYNPVTGVDLWTAIIPAGAALIVLVLLAIFGKKGKKK